MRRWDCPLYYPLDRHAHHHHSKTHALPPHSRSAAVPAPSPSMALVPVSSSGRIGLATMKVQCAELVKQLADQEGIDVSEEDLNFDCLYIC